MKTFADYTRNFGQGIGREPEAFLSEAKELISLEVWDKPLEDYPKTFSLFVDSLLSHFC